MARAYKHTGPDGSEYVVFRCPGCTTLHSVIVHAGTLNADGPVWGWNGSLDMPTFTPSLLLWLEHRADEDAEEKKYVDSRRCHTFINDGRIQYLSDCGHALAGQTVDLSEIETPAEA